MNTHLAFAIFGEAISNPKLLISRNSTIAGALRFGWGKSDRGDEHIIGLENGAVLARSVRRKVEGKRWNEKALKMVTGTPWNPLPGEVVARRRYITRALEERYGPTEDCGACFRKSQQHTERCRARFELLCAGEDGTVEARAQEGQPAAPDPAAPNLISTSAAAEIGAVDTDAMESDITEPAVSSRAHASVFLHFASFLKSFLQMFFSSSFFCFFFSFGRWFSFKSFVVFTGFF